MKYWIKTPRIVPLILSRLVWRFSPNKPVVYLTFDDGPNDSTTTDILKILEKEKIKGTFFCIGNNVVKNPEVFQEIIEKGHSVGNHSMSHINGWKVTKNKYLKDIEKATEIIKSNLFRPPYGKLNFSSTYQLKKKFEIVMWDINSGDFDKTLSYSQVIENVLKNARNGSIIVLHDNKKFKNLTLNALLPIIKGLKNKGFAMEAIPFNL
ncbi:MAG: polysaccharide deacetylase family protein [Flavobacteriales bacterium]|jgi:peptidoglycan/xylan/chitin deacetylase (PgdA/CDA1 family)